VYIEDANVAIMIYPYKATQWWFALSDVKSYVDPNDELMYTLTENIHMDQARRKWYLYGTHPVLPKDQSRRSLVIGSIAAGRTDPAPKMPGVFVHRVKTYTLTSATSLETS
jgi:hypothetical protein